MSTLLALFQVDGILDAVLGSVGTILYPLFSVIFTLIRLVQNIFYAFAGIDKMYYEGTEITSVNDGGENSTGIVYHLLTRPLVKNMIFSIMILALFLIVIFTVMAFIKNAYSAKPKNWKEIVGSAIKGLANFVLLPVFCLLGVWMGNILLQAINGATSTGGSTSMERKLFAVCAYNANMFRCSENVYAYDLTYSDVEKLAESSIMLDGSGNSFMQAHGIEKHTVGDTDEIDSAYYTYYAEIVDQIYAETDADLNWYWNVGEFYSLWSINYFLLIVGGLFMLYVLGALAFAMIRRIFIILILLIISPGVCALYPLDDGKSVQSWSGEVKKQVLSAYGAVAGMNIFFSILPLFDSVQPWSGWGGDIINIFIIIVGLQCVREITGLISGFVGGEDAYSKAGDIMTKTKDKAWKGAIRTGAFVYGTGKVFSGAAKWTKKLGGAAFSDAKGKIKDGLDARKDEKTAKKRLSNAEDNAIKTGHAVRDESGKLTYKKGWNEETALSEWDRKVTKDENDAKRARERTEAAKRDKRVQRYKDKHGLSSMNEARDEMKKKADEKAQKKQERKEKFANTNLGQALAETGGIKGFGNGVLTAAKTLSDETGLSKLGKDFIEGVTKNKGTYKKNSELFSEGAYGQNKVFKEIMSAVNKEGLKDKDKVLASLLRKLPSDFANAIAKVMLKTEHAGALGLDDKSTLDDMTMVDQSLGMARRFADLINNAPNKEAKDQYVSAAIKSLTDQLASTDGNEKVQDAIKAALDEITIKATNDEPIKLNAESITELSKASAAAFDDLPNIFQKNIDKIIKIIEKNKKS